jgi:hypothetical protein
MAILGISYDHRPIDGVPTSKLLGHIKDKREQRDWEVANWEDLRGATAR